MTKRIISLFLALILVLSLASCTGEGDKGDNTEETGPQTITVEEITLKLVSKNGTPLDNVKVSVYGDTEKADSVTSGITDSEGSLKVTAIKRDSYYLFIDDPVPGYKIKDHYEIKAGAENVISLEVKLVDKESAKDLTFGLGDVFFDFELTLPDGSDLTLSSLLEEKKAVVLNFWFFGCQPCMNEIPHMQEAYSANDGSVELIAINYTDGDNDWITSLAETGGLTFPLAKGDASWGRMMNINASPTTVVIDSTGTVAFVHAGTMSAEEFTAIFDYFTSDSYDHTPVRNLSDITK